MERKKWTNRTVADPKTGMEKVAVVQEVNVSAKFKHFDDPIL